MECSNLATHVFCFNDDANGGEALILKTTFFTYDNKPEEIRIQHQFSLQSYCNSASFTITEEITPEKLRTLANELESEMIKAKAKMDETEPKV